MRPKPYARSTLALTAAALVAACMTPIGAARADVPVIPEATQPSSIAPADRGNVLGKDWKKSDDRAWSTSGDADGFHVMVADENEGYTWRTVTTLREPGFDADQWIGNACVTGSGERAVVVYAPRTFTNKSQLMARGGFAAIVDLKSGKTTKLDTQVSLSYYNPGCGVDETAILTQSPGEDKQATRLYRLDTTTGELSKPIEVAGQFTSAVPVKDGSIVAAFGKELVKIGDGGKHTALARTDSVPYRITPDGDGGVVFLDALDSEPMNGLTAPSPPAASTASTRAKHLTAAQVHAANADSAKPEVLAEGPLTETGVSRSAGTVYLTGDTKQTIGKMPGTVRRLPKALKDAAVSTKGHAVLNQSAWADKKDSRVEPGSAGSRPVALDMMVVATGRSAAFIVDPSATSTASAVQGSVLSPALPQSGVGQEAATLSAVGTSPGSATEIVESDRSCSVPRNDPRNQALQPKPRQVEWAVDQLVSGTLNINRPANWKNLGMPAYNPAALFPTVDPLEGGGRIPAQVLLGITAQESNMWQAARSALPGETANPLIGNYYGLSLYDSTEANDWDIDWSKADCGYGVTQVTDHMRLAGRETEKSGVAWDYQKQRAVALDYTANIAAGMQILIGKWNQTRRSGLIVNNGNSAKIENWFFALWAYNSGFYEQADAGTNGGQWGVGWANNPANPEWDESRNPFLEDSHGANHYADAAHPQNWPYPEKVIGFAAHPVEGLEAPNTSVAGFRPAWWNGSPSTDSQYVGSAAYNRARAKPPIALFCTTDNNCDASKISTSAANSLGGGPCTLANYHCWWNKPAQWKNDCDYSCGNELVRFDSTYPEQDDGTSYPPNCSTTGLPAGALIVDDVADDVPSIRPNCPRTWTNAGSFSMDFGPGETVKDQNGNPTTGWPAKIDTHQLGAGFGGHLYFAHTRVDDAKGQRLKVTGTWKFNNRIAGLTEVFAHIPDTAAKTDSAIYSIETSDGIKTRMVDQSSGITNRWISLGSYRFSKPPVIHLSNTGFDWSADKDVAFDAVAIAALEPDASALTNISLPAANPNAPDIDYSAAGAPEPFPGYGPLASAGSAALAKSSTNDQSCSPLSNNGNISNRLCVTTSPSAPMAESEIAKLSATAQGGPPPIVPWCATTPGHNRNRFDACIWRDINVELVLNNQPVGTANFKVRQEIAMTLNKGTFRQIMEIYPTRIDPQLVSLKLDLLPGCDPAPICPVSEIYWNGSTTWLAEGDTHVAYAAFEHTWTSAAESSDLNLNWSISMTTPVGVAQNVAVWSYYDALAVRCDQRNSGGGMNYGCVFKNYIPSFTVNTAKHPTASAFYWVLMKRLPTHPGSKAASQPLERVSQAQKDANRAKICPTGWSVDTQVPEPTCEEYPFASTAQSGGGIPGATGDDCVQMTGPQNPDGTWELKADLRFFPPPTWSEGCGRGTITKGHNEGAGSDLGAFYGAQRIMTGDKFYVDTPGFENCTVLACNVRL